VANKKNWLRMLTLALVFGMIVVGCSDGSTSSDGKKTLVVKNIPASVYAYGVSGGAIGLFPVGTTTSQASSQIGLVAGAYLDNRDITVAGSGPYTLTIPLYTGTGYDRWTGSGTFDIYVQLSGGGGHYYKASSVEITSGTTIVSFDSATEVYY